MSKSIEIQLGEQSFTIRQPTIGQLEKLQDVIFDNTIPDGKKASAVIRIALERDNAEIAAALSELEVPFNELGKASNEILRLAGFITDEAAPAALAAE